MAHRRLPGRRLPVMMLLGVSALILSACGVEAPASTIAPAGNHAQRIYDLLVPIFWMALGVFVVVEGALIYSIIRFRQRPGAGIPAQIQGNTRIEILWTIAPALIVLVIAVLTFRTQAANAYQPPDAMQINVTGYQWWWRFEYPEQGVVTAGDLYVPVGRDVTLSLTGQDVIHSFWAPRLAGKTDAIPGKTNYLSFRAEEEGIFHGLCAEFCGEQHALMRFRVIAVAPETFDRWIEQYRTAPPDPVDEAALRGREVFLAPENGCIGCHAISGTQAQGISGPNLDYFGSRLTIASGVLDNTPENLARWLRNPEEVKPGNIMSSVVKEGTLTEQEIADLVAYLESMQVDIDLPAER